MLCWYLKPPEKKKEKKHDTVNLQYLKPQWYLKPQDAMLKK